MKRLLTLIGVSVVALALVACGGSDKGGGGLLGGANKSDSGTSSDGNIDPKNAAALATAIAKQVNDSANAAKSTPASSNSSNSTQNQPAKPTTAPSNNSSSTAASNDVTKFSNQYVMNFFNVTFGFTDPQVLLNMFDDSCKSKVNAKQISDAIGMIKAFLPKVDKLEDVDLGKLDVQKVSGGYSVKPVDPNAARIKVNGQFIKANDYFAKLGFGDEANDVSNTPLTIKETNGKLFVSDCSELTDLTSP